MLSSKLQLESSQVRELEELVARMRAAEHQVEGNGLPSRVAVHLVPSLCSLLPSSSLAPPPPPPFPGLHSLSSRRSTSESRRRGPRREP